MIRLLRFSLLMLCLAALPAAAQMPEPEGMETAGGGAHFETRLAEIEAQMRALEGRVEQAEFAAKKLEQTIQRMQSDADARFARLESASAAAAAAPAPSPAPVAAPAIGGAAPAPAPVATPSPAAAATPAPAPNPKGTLGALKMQDGKVTGAVKKPEAPPLPETPADYSLNPQEQYDRAFGLLRQANYEEAGKAFKSFIDRNPQDKLVLNAKYWYGETLYVRGQFQDSAVAFADTYQADPKGAKAPDSLLKLGMSLAALDKKEEACTTFLSLKSKYPNAPLLVRQRADETRTKLGCK